MGSVRRCAPGAEQRRRRGRRCTDPFDRWSRGGSEGRDGVAVPMAGGLGYRLRTVRARPVGGTAGESDVLALATVADGSPGEQPHRAAVTERSTLSLTTGATPTFTGCLRNARSVATAARACGPCVAVIACHAPILQRCSLIGDSVRGHSRNHCLGDGMVHQVLQALVRPRIDSGDRRRRRLGRQPGERRILAQSSLARVPTRAAYSFTEPDRAAIFPIRRPLALCIRKDTTNQWIGNALCVLRVSGYISGKVTTHPCYQRHARRERSE